MRQTRPKMMFWGGLLTMLGAVGMCATGSSPHGQFHGWPGLLVPLLEAWPWCIVVGLFLLHMGKGGEQTGHCYEVMEGLKTSAKGVYVAVRQGLQEREYPSIQTDTVNLLERGLVGFKRRHLRIDSGYFSFDLCAFPYGKDFAVSWRCYARIGMVERVHLSIPILGWLVYFLFFRYTPMVEDKGLLFQAAVHRQVRAVINSLCEEQGLRVLSDSEFQPILTDMYRRWG